MNRISELIVYATMTPPYRSRLTWSFGVLLMLVYVLLPIKAIKRAAVSNMISGSRV